MNIQEAIEKYQTIGYEYDEAESKVSQDIILSQIAKSKYRKNITIKGGVVIHNISNDIRRATRDLDIDFIKYSLENKSIVNFVNSLNSEEDDIKIKVVGKITALHHQDYDGKRVFIHIEDRYGNSVNTKLDIGVHKLFELEQDEYCFDLSLINKKVNLLINSKEQIFTEKLKSLLKLGFRSTRYKDIFDFYYLINMAGLDKNKLIKSIEILIINDESMREKSINEITKRLDNIFKSPRYLNNLNNPEVNWLDISIDEAIETVVDYIYNLSDIKISV